MLRAGLRRDRSRHVLDQIWTWATEQASSRDGRGEELLNDPVSFWVDPKT
jgi:hypothetical protein